MKKLVFLCLALLVVPASAAFAQIDLTWNNCILADEVNGEPPAAANVNFTCTGTAIQRYAVHGSYKTPTAIPDFIAMDISMDLQQQVAGALVPFYHYETGGCAVGARAFSKDNFATGPGTGAGNACTLLLTAWGDGGTSAGFGDITTVIPDYNGIPGRARILAAVARSSEDPFSLDAGTNYYGFHVRLVQTSSIRTNCAGCTTPAAWVWNSATLYGRGGTIVVLAGPSNKGLGTSSPNSYCAMINSANLSTCQATPTRNTTWGRLKTIYR